MKNSTQTTLLKDIMVLCLENKMSFDLSAKHDQLQVMAFDDNSDFLFNEHSYINSKDGIEDLFLLKSKVEKFISNRPLIKKQINAFLN